VVTRFAWLGGDADDRVPIEQSRSYARAAVAAGDPCQLLEFPGADHFVLIVPRSAAWAAVAAHLEAAPSEDARQGESDRPLWR